jgi:peptide/nickel transport system substrate-binding protein
MKKFLFITLIVFISTIGLVFDSFGQQPQYGGIVKMIYSAGPAVIGYYPEMGPADHAAAFPGMECIMDMSEQRKLVPFLAESVDFDDNKLTMTIRLRKGIKFHDGSDLNAEACAWNYQLLKDTNKIQYGEQIKRIEVVDNYTVILHLSSYHNQMPFAYGWIPMFSKVAYDTKGKEWCRANPVGTGPFKLVDWKRESHIKWEKFDGYWQKGRPYLEGIEARYIPDQVAARMLMEAKEADMWITPLPREQSALEKKGFIRKAYWPALCFTIDMNTKDPAKPTANLKVREAIEYAIDKASLAKALGFGYWKPLKMMHPQGEWAYDPNWPGRPYNPEKAKKLLAEAGYANGLNLKLLAFVGIGGKDVAEAIKAYLAEVGINADVDMADPGRYWGSLFGKGWDDMVLCFHGIDQDSLATTQVWYGHEPKSNLASFKRTDKLLALSREAVTHKDEAKQKEAARLISLELSEQALMIPIYYSQTAYLIQPWVHTNYLETGMVRWKMYDMWMEKH